MLKTASTLKEFTSKIKVAMEGQTLTPEAVQEIAEEIRDVAEVAAELAEEISENVPVEGGGAMDRMNGGEDKPEQLEVAQDETEEEKKKRMEKTAADDDDDDKIKEHVANLTKELTGLKREAALAKLAPKYASLFPKNMHEAKMNEITNSKEPLPHIEVKVQEAQSIIQNKTMLKIASQSDSIFDIDSSDSEEVNIAAKL